MPGLLAANRHSWVAGDGPADRNAGSQRAHSRTYVGTHVGWRLGVGQRGAAVGHEVLLPAPVGRPAIRDGRTGCCR